jgi:hypothetical protein
MTGTGTKLRAIGFCGVDDSVHPNLLGIIANAYPLVEFGVLFRPDKVLLRFRTCVFFKKV